ncbi:uncharacterized protein LOC128245008 isoform X2 [Mya arenaria]|uniref:uncharacterized protein LOC128245008 isoform X2 n=1 Tax=Mya arenaria TaxID=6604 RepID=UPI0022E21287|nr:uncharacterized protein LOC128245008 isoform X2 [Mya arenaria]
MKKCLCLVVCLFVLLSFGYAHRTRRKETLKVLTFNTALTGVIERFFPDAMTSREMRRDAIMGAVRDSGADLVCLQEIPLGVDVATIVRNLSSVYPYSFSDLHLTDGSLPSQTESKVGPCDTKRLGTLLTCVTIKGCVSRAESGAINEFLKCVVNCCGIEFEDLLRNDCQNCLQCVVLTVYNPADLLKTCGSPVPNLSVPSLNSHGLLLLSKRPLTNTAAVEFYPNDPEILAHGYIRAKVDNKITAACIHASPLGSFNTEPLKRRFRSVQEQLMFEGQQVFGAFQSLRPLVLLGDFNVGPRTREAEPIAEEAYMILAQLFSTDVVDCCTVCPGNPFIKFNHVIDHIFAGGASVKNAKRVFTTDEVSVQPGTTRLPVSDHFGVIANVCFRTPVRRH